MLGAANTHAGGTLISGGTVVLANAGGLGSGAVAINDATLRTTVDAQLSQPMFVTSEATLDVASGTTTLTGMLDGSRSTGCFIKSGAGRLNMAGTAVLANGTCVNEGTLSANGVLLSNVQVERGGTVRGTGAIAGNMRVDGTLAPGNSPGTLAVTGTVTLTDDATLQIDIDGYGTGAGAGNYRACWSPARPVASSPTAPCSPCCVASVAMRATPSPRRWATCSASSAAKAA